MVSDTAIYRMVFAAGMAQMLRIKPVVAVDVAAMNVSDNLIFGGIVMKLSNVKVIIVAGALASMVVFPALMYGAGIVGSAHDFSGNSWSGSRICEPCHTVHNSDTSVTGAPLWNHEVTTASFTLYTSSTLDATIGQPTESKLCLSCHDGTVEIDSFGGNAGTIMMPAGDHLIGTNLQDMHPIGFTYDSTLATADGGLYDPSTKNTTLGGTITDDMLGSGGNLSCASCHDVHDAAGNADLVRINNTNSALCLTCHDK